MIVVDASAVVDVLLDTGERGSWARAELRAADVTHAPHLLDYEALSATRKMVLLREISAERGAQALEDLKALPLRRYPAQPFVDRAWALRHTISARDAFYVALAEALDCALVTTDGRLARSHGHEALVRSP
ncbi:MAG: type II toxin-antitoxin system VapC family toxin [Gaiellaceae bacterium MAG52_C11]|nr:type II toxin-antitoxin system VapC family toxin [Candidatus Gaiellasilicea maunaloa]